MDAPVLTEEMLEQIEQVSWLMRDGLNQIGDIFGLSAFDRVLVLEHLHYCSTQACERVYTAEEKIAWGLAKAAVAARAEAVRAENLAEDAARAAVNTSGGQA